MAAVLDSYLQNKNNFTGLALQLIAGRSSILFLASYFLHRHHSPTS